MGQVVKLSARKTQGARRKASEGVPFVKLPPRDAKAQERDHARARYRAADRLRIALRDCMDLGIPTDELYDAVRWAIDGGE